MKKRFSLAIILAGVLAAGCHSMELPADDSAWDHKTVTISAVSPMDYERQVQDLTREGWTVVKQSKMSQNGSNMTATIVLKRPKQ
jgi:hypothetical protein